MRNAYFIKTFFLIIFLLQAAFAEGQGIRGVVFDATTQIPLVNANILVEGTRLGTVTDNTGLFRLNLPNAGTFQVKVTMMGYQTLTREVVVDSEAWVELKFALKTTVLEMDAVSVIGKKYRNVVENPKEESPALELSTTTLTQREIKRQGAKTLIEAMKFVPGALVESRGRKVKQFFSVRGQVYPYPEYALNGAWQREFHELPYFFSSADIEKIEIIRSSAALLTGLSGMAGVINIVTKEYAQPETAQEVEYGTFGTYRAHISHGARVGDWGYATGVGFQHTDGPDEKHAAEEIANFYGNLRWQPTAHLNIRFNLFHLNGKRELALAEPPASKRFQTELMTFDPVRATLSDLKFHFQPSPKYSTELLAYYSDRQPVSLLEDPDTYAVSSASERDFEWGVNLTQALKLGQDNVLRVGGLYHHWLAPNGKRFYVGRRCDLETYSLVVVDEHQFGRLNVDAGLRWARTYINEYGAFNINGSPRGFGKVPAVTETWEPSVFQGSVGLNYNLTHAYSLHFNLAAGEVVPRNGTLDLELQAPENETRLKLDLGFRAIAEGLGQVSLVGFMTRQNNAIVLSGQTAEVDDRIFELYLNRNQAQLGLEIELRSARLYQLLDGFVNFTAMSNRAEMDGTMERNRELPRYIGNLGIYLQRGPLDLTLLGKFTSSFENTRFAGPAPDGNVYPQPLGDFFALDLTAGWSFGSRRNTRLYLEIQNLTDKKYSTVVGYPDFGRRFTVGVRRAL